MTDDLRSSVFISHNWNDKLIAERIATALRRCVDARVWIDFHELMPGDSIRGRIDAAIASMDLVVVVCTKDAAASDAVTRELAAAVEAGVRVVPAFVEYDAQGRRTPPPPPLDDDVLGVHFHHFPTGLAHLVHLVFELEAERLPASVSVDVAGRRMVNRLRGYLDYLATFRDQKRRAMDESARARFDEDRAFWVDRIVEEIERFVDAGGDVDSVRALVDAARRSDVDDPEGIGTLVTRLEAALAARHAAAVDDRCARPTDGLATHDLFREHSPMDATTERIRRQIDAALADERATGRTAALLRQSQPHLADEQVVAFTDFMQAYLRQTPDLLDAMARAAHERGAAEQVRPVIELAAAYFDDPDDLVPDAAGVYGLLDDAYFAQRFVEQVSTRVAAQTGHPLVDVDLGETNRLARIFLGDHVTDVLDARVQQTLQDPRAGMSTMTKVAIGVGAGLALLAIGGMFTGAGGYRDPNVETEMSQITGGMFS